MKKPLIFISNDDGYDAKGINFLIEVLQPFGKLIVVAPDSGRSGASAALTVKTPIRYELVKKTENLEIYKCNGTPVDCVKIGLSVICKDKKPDFLFSGINHGSNVSVAIHYSGTLGAVIEGCIWKIPSVGFSLDDYTSNPDFEICRDSIKKIVSYVLQNSLPVSTCLNVNIPNVSNLKGIKICRQTFGRWIEEFNEFTHPDGWKYYWLTGDFSSDEKNPEGSDLKALKDGYVAVVPSKIDMTDYSFLEKLKNNI